MSISPPTQQGHPPFSSAEAHLSGMLGWLHSLLAWQVTVTRHLYGPLADDKYRGLYSSEAEADLLSAAWPALPPQLVARRRELAVERASLENQAVAAERAGTVMPLLRLGWLFRLGPLERDVLLLALAPELDLRYERLYAHIQDDVTRKRPSVDLALRLFCLEPAERLTARLAFAPTAPLLRHHLIQLVDDGQRQPSLATRGIRLDDRIAAVLLGQPLIDPLLTPSATLVRPERRLDNLILPPDLTERLRQLVAMPDERLVLALQGRYGSGRRALAEALAAEIGCPVLTVDIAQLRQRELSPVEAAQRVLREATLDGALIFWQGADDLLHDEAAEAWRQALLTALDGYRGWSILPIEQPWEARGQLRRSRYIRIELPVLSYTDRLQLWRQRLGDEAPDEAALEALASTFRLSAGQIRDAVTMARSLARWQGAPLSVAELAAACRAQSSGRLDNLARKIKSTYTWDDIVLPGDQVAQLREICAQVRQRRRVLEHWGFDRHLAMGKGLNVLFAGQSGTGKTMAAEIIAAELGLELFKVDLSAVVSKYIGETEKNLDRIFTAAQEANAILFFDEADALFGKRSEVKDAHDRYANIEVGYLLQKMEEYDGVVILATNLRKNMDDAFLRRLHMAIDFPFPEETERRRIWEKVFPPEAPLADDIDHAFLSRQLKLAGGNIRNIALLAAFLAAEAGGPITMAHVVQAAKREYQKLGKLITEADFGPYLALVRTT